MLSLYRIGKDFGTRNKSSEEAYTVQPVCNDHLYNKIYYLFFFPVMHFNDDWRYQFTLANNFCLLELI